MWAYDFFEAAPQARPLRTHLIANNLFLKFWYNEYYIPKEMRLGQNMRFIRMLVTLCIYGMVVVATTSRDNTRYAMKCSERHTCRAACVELHFPEPRCQILKGTSITFDTNVYDELYRFDYMDSPLYEGCEATVNHVPNVQKLQELREGQKKVPKIEVCFKACRDPSTDLDSSSVALYGDDERPVCANLPTERQRDLLCVAPQSPCEVMAFDDEVPVPQLNVGISRTQVIQSIVLTIPAMSIVDILFVTGTAVTVPSVQDLGRSSIKCGLQWLIFAVCCALFLFFSSGVLSAMSVGRPWFFLVHWVFVVLLDQVRNIVVQIMIWYFMERRCGSEPVLLNDEEQYDDDDDDHLSFFALMRLLIVKAVDSKTFEIAQYALIGSYAILVVAAIVIEELLMNQQINDFLDQVDTVFLAFFFIEILMLFLAQGREYVFNIWNVFDATVIIFSIIAKIQLESDPSAAEDQTNLSMLRLLRILRLVVLLRKGQSTDRQKKKNQKGVLNFSSPVERVLEAFHEIKETKGLTILQKDQLDWASDVIAQNKLFQINVDTDKSKSGDGFLEQEIQVWVKIASDNAEDSKTWGGDELEDWLLGKSRRKAKEDGMELAESILQAQVERAPIRDRCAKYFAEMIDKWDFSVFDLRGLLGKESLTLTERKWKGPAEYNMGIVEIDEELVEMMALMMLHTCKYHDVYSLFDIPPQGLQTFAEKLEQGYMARNPYHNSIHATDVLQAVSVLFKWCKNLGQSNNVLNIQDMLSVIFAAAMLDYEHPGFTNTFLNRTKHPIAVRYNDVSCLENHHAAAGFLCLLNADPDPLQNISESQYQQMRKAIVRMILSTDVSHQLTELTIFKTKMTAKDFPSSRQEDKQVLMNTLLRCADVSNVTRPLTTALSWAMRVMAEFFLQGDMEVSMNFTLTPFFDRSDFELGIPKCQLGFIDFMVLPLYEALSQLLPEVADICFPNIQMVHQHFDNILHPNRQDEIDGDALTEAGPGMHRMKSMLGKRQMTAGSSKKGGGIGSAFQRAMSAVKNVRKRGKSDSRGSPV
jgi:hypothetical protein